MDTYPLITVKKLGESPDFFLKLLGMVIVFEAGWVVMLARQEAARLCWAS